MASITIMLFDSPSKMLKDGTFPISLKVTHQRKRKYFALGKSCLPKQWSKDTSKFKRSYPSHTKENDVLLSILSRASNIIRDFERDGIPFDFGLFETKFLMIEKSSLVQDYFQHHIDTLENEGKVGTASPYKTTKNALLGFVKQKRKELSNGFKLNHINFTFLIDFESWLRTQRNCKDTSISVYMRSLRSIINKAIKEKILKRENYPFDEYSIDKRLNTQTQKRAIPKETIKEIESLELSENTPELLAQHIFLFGYYTRGINFVDIAYITPKSIINEGTDKRLIYVRRKTGKPFNIKLLPPAIKILEYYIERKVTKGEYIFPIFDDSIHKTEKQKHTRRKTALRKINRGLKSIATMIGQENLNLTTYVSRHSYATVLKKAGKEIAVISEAMGHKTEAITQTYLKQFENTKLDEADESLL